MLGPRPLSVGENHPPTSEGELTSTVHHYIASIHMPWREAPVRLQFLHFCVDYCCMSSNMYVLPLSKSSSWIYFCLENVCPNVISCFLHIILRSAEEIFSSFVGHSIPRHFLVSSYKVTGNCCSQSLCFYGQKLYWFSLEYPTATFLVWTCSNASALY